MTLSDTATAQLLETFRVGGGAELIRDAVRLVLQELIEAEATEAIGAARYERNADRATQCNGHRSRLLATHTPAATNQASAETSAFARPCRSVRRL
ncbi:MAG: hypothetical protein F4Y05_00105 [Acidimicrobiaceae bacterium]|nr:hypothetical protein [Acidimicrobiaceae bacterium]MYI35762.1 hypothetical protein [Acidimicrobiaceae bacterium]